MEVTLMIKAGMTTVGVEPVETAETQITNATISGHGYREYMAECMDELDPII